MQHVFEKSGLGKAPFSVLELTENQQKNCPIFYCEHCGTMLQNRHFVKSQNGKVSVVGIDCLKKTGDAGLISAVKQAQRNAKQAQRLEAAEAAKAAQEELERARFDGKTKAEIWLALYDRIEALKSQHCKAIADTLFFRVMSEAAKGTATYAGSSFAIDMRLRAYHLEPFTLPMQVAIINMIAKHLADGSRKNSAAFKAALPAAQDAFNEVASIVCDTRLKIDKEEKAIDLLMNK